MDIIYCAIDTIICRLYWSWWIYQWYVLYWVLPMIGITEACVEICWNIGAIPGLCNIANDNVYAFVVLIICLLIIGDASNRIVCLITLVVNFTENFLSRTSNLGLQCKVSQINHKIYHQCPKSMNINISYIAKSLNCSDTFIIFPYRLPLFRS